MGERWESELRELQQRRDEARRFEQVSPCAYGLADMAGNVREWTRSLKLEYPYVAAKAEDPAATGRRAIRGGSYERLFVGAERVRAANREDAEPDTFDRYTGFRVALICRKDRGCTWQEPD